MMKINPAVDATLSELTRHGAATDVDVTAATRPHRVEHR
jgi:hypothetical protein